ncbi:MAG: hypothetical protein Q9187_004701 [Circinaria calcarea]
MASKWTKSSLFKSVSLPKIFKMGERSTPQAEEPKDTLADQLEAANTLLSKRSSEIAALRRQVVREKANKAIIAQELYAAMKESNARSKAVDKMAEDIEVLQEQLETKANKEASRARSFEVLKSEVSGWEKILVDDCDALKQENNRVEAKYQEALLQNGQLHEQIQSLKDEISDWETTDAQLEADRDALKAEGIKTALKYGHARLENSNLRKTLVEVVNKANDTLDIMVHRLKTSNTRNAEVREILGEQIRGLVIEKEELEDTISGLDHRLRIATAHWYQERYRRYIDGDYRFDGNYWSGRTESFQPTTTPFFHPQKSHTIDKIIVTKELPSNSSSVIDFDPQAFFTGASEALAASSIQPSQRQLALAGNVPNSPQPSPSPPAAWSKTHAIIISTYGTEKLQQLRAGRIDASILQIVFVKLRQMLLQKWLDVPLAYHSIYKRLKMLSLILWFSNGCKLASVAQQPWLIWHDDVAIRIEATGEITNQMLDRMESDLKLWLIAAQNKTLQCFHSKDYPALISGCLRGILIHESETYPMGKKVNEHVKDRNKLLLVNDRLSKLNVSLEEKNRKLGEENTELKAKNDKLETQNNRVELKVVFLDIDLEGKNQQVADLKKEKAAIQQDKLRRIEELEEDFQQLQANVQGLQTAVQHLRAENQNLETDNEDLASRMRDLELQLRTSELELRRERYLRGTGSDYMWT